VIPQTAVSFLTPLRKKLDPAVWEETCRLLSQTIGSLQNQSNSAFTMVVAGHDRPALFDDLEDERFQFASIHFGDRALDRAWQIDKSWKLATAAATASKHSPRYYMSLDADDLLHRDLVAWMAQQNDPAILCDRAWEVDLDLGKALVRKDMSHRCQSTVAFKTSDFPLPKDCSWDEWVKVPFISVGHGDVKTYLEEQGRKWTVPPMNSMIYLRGHGSNVSDTAYTQHKLRRRLGFQLFGTKIGASFWQDFRLEEAK